MRILKNILLYVFISSLIMIGSCFLHSNFIDFFLQKDLLTILIALFGLNVTVLSILVSKLSSSKSDYPELDLNEITNEMKFSLLEFFVIIILAVAMLVISSSEVIVFHYKTIICNSILLSTLIYSLVIVWDTAQSIFILIKEENNIE